MLKTPQGEMAMEQEETVVLPDRVHQKLTTPMGPVTMVATPEAGFMISPMGAQDLPSSQKADLLGGAKESPFYLAAHLDDEDLEFAIAGTETIGDVETTVLQISGQGIQAKWYVDPQTGHVLRTAKAGSQGLQLVDHTEFGEFDGLTFPAQGTITVGGQEAGSFVLKGFELDPEIDPALFEKPAA